MLREILLATTALALFFFIVGCKTGEDIIGNHKASDTYAVVVGMEHSRFAGDCPGAGIDSTRMHNLLSHYASDLVLLQDAKATKAAVVAAIKHGVEQSGTGLFIFYYSGHGGSDPFPDTKDELDGRDEYFCFYDTYFRDDEMWKLIQQCKGRFLLIADCCHSQTIFSLPSIDMRRSMPMELRKRDANSVNMLCWSGCPDNTYSYGSATGGQFTNALLRHYTSDKTYDGLWNLIKNDSTLRQYEDPQRTIIGSGFGEARVFR